MRDQQDAAFVFFQGAFQFLFRIIVQVIRRFVKDEEVGPLQRQSGQGQPAPFAAREGRYQFEDVVVREQEAPEQVAGRFLAHRLIVQQRVEHVAGGIETLVSLGVVGDLDVRPELDPASQRVDLSDERPQSRCFPAAVRPEQGDSIAPLDRQFLDRFKEHDRFPAAIVRHEANA